MPNRGDMHDGRVPRQVSAVNSASGNDALYFAESADDRLRRANDTDGLYLVGETEAKTSFSPQLQDLLFEEPEQGSDLAKAVVDIDITAAKWAWAALVVGHCLLIYFMIQSLD